jgi:hypothetical protein
MIVARSPEEGGDGAGRENKQRSTALHRSGELGCLQFVPLGLNEPVRIAFMWRGVTFEDPNFRHAGDEPTWIGAPSEVASIYLH